MRARTTLATGAAALIALTITDAAHAQEAQGEAKVTATAVTPATATTPATAVSVEEKVEMPDHERFIGHFAVGYFGIQNFTLASGFGAGGPPGVPNGGAVPTAAVPPTTTTVAAPIIGVRYWFQRNLGVDAGLGFGMSGGTVENSFPNGNTTATVDTDHVSTTAFALHGGLPIAFAYGRHYTFELIPEATLGIANGTIKAAPGATGNANNDTSLSGFRLDVGARVGAEISFGMIGIPELALQATIGLYLRRETWKASQGNTSASDGSTVITTSVQSDPWALFTNNISALYYF